MSDFAPGSPFRCRLGNKLRGARCLQGEEVFCNCQAMHEELRELLEWERKLPAPPAAEEGK